ncbi:polysaccharide pyruvyl transferase family protein [Oscillatoria sp. FACHB-1407]|uniref:polysaccharide pyruvyl transferase family protein n=1 Tax=Oscillatoria sp. FACHB-1407 TaxID=2692847 RepID=UPI001683C9CC|nr:polysaccharide pyruvyl transferase family protein [Oscillatoria sp. FACHB-1407]MBD2464472.1 polysaccharide pyruvyl transferase family protein [Oscillatoria sp. FACHB-1407]
MTYSTAEDLKRSLHHVLGQLDRFEQCVLLDYPDYLNLGDHLIWLGSIFYLTQTLQSKIVYTASANTFSASAMEDCMGNAPILLNGGGNLGDLWMPCQRFREQIISQYRDRPIVILPQSIYFAQADNLKRAAEIFNAHPNLTLFTRDQFSYEFARQHFHNCQVFLAPDMVFQLAGMPDLSLNFSNSSSVLYHCRTDRELNRSCVPALDVPNLVVQDWASYGWVLGMNQSPIKRAIAQMIRAVWQRGLTTLREWMSRQIWLSTHSHHDLFSSLYNPAMHRQSWDFFHSGLYQFQQHRLIVTNRLHGHILSVLLGIPHVFLPNSYHKNEAFYQTWTKDIPFCTFVNDPAHTQSAIEELLSHNSSTPSHSSMSRIAY